MTLWHLHKSVSRSGCATPRYATLAEEWFWRHSSSQNPIPNSRASQKQLSIPSSEATPTFPPGSPPANQNKQKTHSISPRCCHKLSFLPSILLRVHLSPFSKVICFSIKLSFPILPLSYEGIRNSNHLFDLLTSGTPKCEHMRMINKPLCFLL